MMRSAQLASLRCSSAAARLPPNSAARSIKTAATGDCGALATTLQQLAAEHAATLNVTLGTGRFGLCLTSKIPDRLPPPPVGEPHLAIRVPLALVLSAEVPGCCPAALASPPLQSVLHELRGSEWELRLAAILLWAVRQEPEGPVGCFWGR